jgi:hypothetical protein
MGKRRYSIVNDVFSLYQNMALTPATFTLVLDNK